MSAPGWTRWERGRNAGFVLGYALGHMEGFTVGRAGEDQDLDERDAEHSSPTDAYEQGHAEGFALGYALGYTEGFVLEREGGEQDLAKDFLEAVGKLPALPDGSPSATPAPTTPTAFELPPGWMDLITRWYEDGSAPLKADVESALARARARARGEYPPPAGD